MVTVPDAFMAAYVAGAIGLLLGAVIVATARTGRRNRRQAGVEVDPPTRLEQILRDELGREVDDLDAEWLRLNQERDR